MSDYHFGPERTATGTLFRLWAPLQEQVRLTIDGGEAAAMERAVDGWHHLHVTAVDAGATYAFVLADGLTVPDPASRFQPQDVHGPSELVDLDAYRWQATGWRGREWEEIVLYELHVGAFTPEGTFRGAIDRLDHLRDLGVTALQIMPVSDFPGGRGWGYDGVLPYAPDASYGRPDDFQALVDAAHERGLCVFLDVVYNHFGPDGNYLPVYAPLFTDNHTTPWGSAINYDGDGSRPIRDFVIENALYWLNVFRLDGLRLDAVHAIKDDSQEHLLMELARRARAAAGERRIHLVVENENNDSDLIARDNDGRVKAFTAQWNDDIHHVLHVAATGETFGYYADYADDRAAKMGRALAQGFVYQGEHMPYRGETRGKPSAGLPPTAFISFMQNHDQIGNRALGDRMSSLNPHDVLRAIAAVYLLCPQIPMLFMGEEWGADEPFPFFCEFDEEMNEKVRMGRREELSRLPGFDGNDVPDPTTKATFLSAKLDWERLAKPDRRNQLDFYRRLLGLRRDHVVPLLTQLSGERTSVRVFDQRGLAIEWTAVDGRALRLACNLSDRSVTATGLADEADTFLALGRRSQDTMPPWTVEWSILKGQA